MHIPRPCAITVYQALSTPGFHQHAHIFDIGDIGPCTYKYVRCLCGKHSYWRNQQAWLQLAYGVFFFFFFPLISLFAYRVRDVQ